MHELHRNITAGFTKKSVCQMLWNSESIIGGWTESLHLGRNTTNQIFTVKQIFEKPWEYGKDLFTCFVDLEKEYEWIPKEKLWKVLQEYGQWAWMISCWLPFSLSTASYKSVFVSKVSNQSHSMWVLVSGKCAFCLLSFS